MTIKLHAGVLKRLPRGRISALLAMQVFLAGVIFVALVSAVLLYQKTVFVVLEPKNSLAKDSLLQERVLVPEVKPLGFYQDLLSQRSIFNFKQIVAAPTHVVDGLTPQVDNNFSSRYIVQGIVVDENPQAIIKDTQNAKTYFIHRNEKLEGATLMDIEGNQLIFNRSGKMLKLIKK